MRLLGFCLMPNHWHLVPWPREGGDGELSAYVGWVTNTHVKRYRMHYHDSAGGHLYQGRFRSFPVQDDTHLLTALRYVEANPLRAKLAERADDWPWCSFAVRERSARGCRPEGLLSEWPLDRPADWRQIVEARWGEQELADIRRCLDRGRPFGDEPWTRRVARALGMDLTPRSRGRPRKRES